MIAPSCALVAAQLDLKVDLHNAPGRAGWTPGRISVTVPRMDWKATVILAKLREGYSLKQAAAISRRAVRKRIVAHPEFAAAVAEARDAGASLGRGSCALCFCVRVLHRECDGGGCRLTKQSGKCVGCDRLLLVGVNCGCDADVGMTEVATGLEDPVLTGNDAANFLP